MPRILVVDDDVEILDLLRAMLEREHFEVLTACDGNEALKLLDSEAIDVMITDILMPEKEGIETILQLRKTHPQIKIIAISGGGKGDANHYVYIAQWAGADRVFTKPLDRTELLRSIEELVT